MPDVQKTPAPLPQREPRSKKPLWITLGVAAALACTVALGFAFREAPRIAEEPPPVAGVADTTLEAKPIGTGMASYYGPGLAGNLTASGERFDPEALTAAHRTLPFGARVRVTNTENGASVIVRINDRGPFAERRIIDVSQAAARKLGMIEQGVATVRLELLP